MYRCSHYIVVFFFIVVLFFVITLSSCATMFNAKSVHLKIVTNEPSYLVLKKDTLKYARPVKPVTVDRDHVPIAITVYNDSFTKTVQVKPRNSFAYWLNLYPNLHLWTGFVWDTKTKRRYTYPKTIYIDLRSKDSGYLTFTPGSKLVHQNKFLPQSKTTVAYSNIFKVTPLQLTELINPSIEFSYERRGSASFSTQFMASYLLPKSLWDMGDDFNPDIKGFSVSAEERYYIRKSAPLGLYAAFEVNYLKNQYRDVSNFGIKNIYSDTSNFVNYPDSFGIKKQRVSFNLKMGYQFIHKRIVFDVYAGLGARYKDVVHFDRINPNDEMEGPRHPNIYYATNLEGKYWTVSIPLNFRVGWMF